MRKGPGKEAKLVFMGHALMENRHGLLVDVQLVRLCQLTTRKAEIPAAA